MKKVALLLVTLTLIFLYWLASSNSINAQIGGGLQNEQTTVKLLDVSREKTDAYLAELLTKEASFPSYYQAHLEAETKINKALSRKIELEFEDLPLAAVIEFFREELNINVQLDQKVLEESSIETSEVVTAHATDITARSALEFVLRNLTEPLTWIVHHEMLLITTLEESDALLQTKFYDVADLVVTQNEKNEWFHNYEQLHEAIQSGCDEEAFWLEEDGQGGTVSFVDALGIHCLVIRQTRETHDQIEVVLAGLRRLRRKEPVVFKNIKRSRF